MGTNLNTEIVVSIGLDAPAVEQAGFGVPLYAATGLGVGFTERLRYYESAAEAAADADLSATAIAAVAAAFSQSRHVERVAVGRIEADEAQIVTWTFSGTPEVGDEIEIIVDGQTATHVVDSTVLNDEVGDLRTALDALLGAAYTVGGAGAVITVTAAVAGAPFTYSSSATPVAAGDIAVAEVLTNANVSISTELDDVVAEEPDWFGLAIYSRNATQVTRAAAWAETNARLFFAQSSDAAFAADTAGNIGEVLSGLQYEYTAIVYHATDADFLDFSLLAKKLEADPDSVTTFWKYCSIAGVAADTLTSTQKANIRGNNGNVYIEFFGIACLANGVNVNGRPIDAVITRAWADARIGEAIAQRLLDVSERNEKIPYDDQGLSQFVGIVQQVLNRGAEIKHFAKVDDALERPTPRAWSLRVSQVPLADRQNRLARVSFIAQLAGAIEKGTITGSVVVDLGG